MFAEGSDKLSTDQFQSGPRIGRPCRNDVVKFTTFGPPTWIFLTPRQDSRCLPAICSPCPTYPIRRPPADGLGKTRSR